MRFVASCAVLVAVLPFCLHAAAVVPGGPMNDNNHLSSLGDSPRVARAEDSPTGNWAMVTRIAHDCAKDPDTFACLAVKAATALERAAHLNGDVQVLPGLTVIKNADDGSSQRDSRSLPTEDELRNQLQEPADADHSSKVVDLVVNSALRFLQSRTLKFNFPQTNAEELSRAIEEGESVRRNVSNKRARFFRFPIVVSRASNLKCIPTPELT